MSLWYNLQQPLLLKMFNVALQRLNKYLVPMFFMEYIEYSDALDINIRTARLNSFIARLFICNKLELESVVSNIHRDSVIHLNYS